MVDKLVDGDMATHKKIRLILVNNLTASLFMASWFKQNKYEEDTDWENIGVFSYIDPQEDYSTDLQNKKKMFEDANISVFKGIIKQWGSCLALQYDDYKFNYFYLSKALAERKIREKTFARVSLFLKGKNLRPEDIVEIWCSNSSVICYFNFICRNAKNVFFEHGLSDIRLIIDKGVDFAIPKKPLSSFSKNKKPYLDYFHSYIKNTLKGIHYKINDFFEKKALFFRKKDLKFDEYISIFADEIKPILNKSLVVKTLESFQISRIAGEVMREDPFFIKTQLLSGNSALIILEVFRTFVSSTDKKDAHLKYYQEFEEYLMSSYISILKENNIENIFFKSRFFLDDYVEEGILSLKNLKKHFNLFIVSDISPLNYPVEFYAEILKPSILIGSYSSALFYSKKMCPLLLTFSYDKWFVEYCLKNFKQCYADYAWMRPFFESNELNNFNSFVPLS